MACYAFLVRLSHPLLNAGLSRRSKLKHAPHPHHGLRQSAMRLSSSMTTMPAVGAAFAHVVDEGLQRRAQRHLHEAVIAQYDFLLWLERWHFPHGGQFHVAALPADAPGEGSSFAIPASRTALNAPIS
jgi:hypothetical protein